MGAVFASAARAPLTSLASVVEMTGDFALTLPVMLAVAIASAISRALSYGTIYTTKLLRRGTDIGSAAGAGAGAAAGRVRARVRRLGVSNSIWDRPGPLSAGEWERVRMYPYLTERMLHQSAALAPLGEIAVQHRERLDGSGYPRGLSGGAISRLARVLGAADAYASMREPRPHRPARMADEAVTEMRAEVRAGPSGRPGRRRGARGGRASPAAPPRRRWPA